MPASTPRGYTYPLYTDPQDFPADIQTLAADIDSDVQGLSDQITNANNRFTAHVRSGATQSIAVSTDVQATFATEEYDNHAMGALPNGINIPAGSDGIYLLTARVTFDAGPAATYFTRVWLTSSAGFIAMPVRSNKETTNGRASVHNVMALHFTDGTVQDDIRVMVRHGAGVAVNISARDLWVSKVSNLLSGD